MATAAANVDLSYHFDNSRLYTTGYGKPAFRNCNVATIVCASNTYCGSHTDAEYIRHSDKHRYNSSNADNGEFRSNNAFTNDDEYGCSR